MLKITVKKANIPAKASFPGLFGLPLKRGTSPVAAKKIRPQPKRTNRSKLISCQKNKLLTFGEKRRTSLMARPLPAIEGNKTVVLICIK